MKNFIEFVKKHKIDILVLGGLVSIIIVAVLVQTAKGSCINEPKQTVIPGKSLVPYVRETKEAVVVHPLDEVEPMEDIIVVAEPVVEIIEETVAVAEPVVEIIKETVVVEEPVVEIIEPIIEEKVLYFDVPLDRDLQDHIFALCEEYEIDPALIIAMIEKESTYNASAKGDSGKSLGLMQIQPRWHKDRMKRLGCDDLLDPYQNVTVGVDIIAGLIDCNEGMEWALMAYNGGSSYANKKMKAGIVTDYAKTVLANAAELVRE